MTYFECPYCPCVFVSEKDLDKHMKQYGDDPEMHKRKWKRNHIDLERNLRHI